MKDLRKLVHLKTLSVPGYEALHYDKMKIKDLLIALLNRSSNAKTEFQNTMNSISMAFNRNFMLREDGKVVSVDDEIEALRKEFQKIAAKYLWGSKKVQNIKKPFSHYFTTVADYFINKEFEIELIDSNTYKEALNNINRDELTKEAYQRERLCLLRNFLGGLTNHKIIELYKKIALLKFEAKLGYKLENRDKLVDKHSVESFEKKLKKQSQRLLKKK